MEFKVGQKVKVVDNILYPHKKSADFRGLVGVVNNIFNPEFTVSNSVEYGVVLSGEPPYMTRSFLASELEPA